MGHLNGCPVLLITTTGGWNVVVVLRNGRLEPLGYGPHDGVAKGIARKREPRIAFSELHKTSDDVDPNGRIFRKYVILTEQLRARRGFGG